MTDAAPTEETLRRLLDTAAPRPWQWLDSGGGETYDELQDGAGEQIATGFRDDLGLDGHPGRMTDGRLCAAAVNALPALLDVVAAARNMRGHIEGGMEDGSHLPGDLCFRQLQVALAELDR